MSSQRRGKWRRISRGSASAAMTINSARPRLSVFVAVEEFTVNARNFGMNIALTFVGSLAQLFVVACLLDKIENLHCQLSISQRVGLGINFWFSFLWKIISKYIWLEYRDRFETYHFKVIKSNRQYKKRKK